MYSERQLKIETLKRLNNILNFIKLSIIIQNDLYLNMNLEYLCKLSFFFYNCLKTIACTCFPCCCVGVVSHLVLPAVNRESEAPSCMSKRIMR